MPFTAPASIPQISYSSYPYPSPGPYPAPGCSESTSTRYSACVPPPTFRDVQSNRALNDDFVSLKSRLQKMLQKGQLTNMPVGFPFHCACSGRENGYSISYSSYEFLEYVYVDSRFKPSCAVFSYTAPSFGRTHKSGSNMMSWRVIVPSRDSMHPREPPSQFTVAHVEVDPVILETPFGLQFMAEPRILLEALSVSLEQGLHITIQLADSRIPDVYPRRKGLKYGMGSLVLIGRDSRGRSEVVYSYAH